MIDYEKKKISPNSQWNQLDNLKSGSQLSEIIISLNTSVPMLIYDMDLYSKNLKCKFYYALDILLFRKESEGTFF